MEDRKFIVGTVFALKKDLEIEATDGFSKDLEEIITILDEKGYDFVGSIAGSDLLFRKRP